MNCLKIRDLYDFLEGDLSPDAAGRIEDHLRVCRRCSRAVEERRLIAEAASSLPPFEVPEDFAAQIMARIAPIGARKPVWLVGLAAATSVLTLISAALIASGKSALEFLSGASHAFWESVKSAAVLAAKLAAVLPILGKILRSLFEAASKGLNVLTSLVHPGLQVFIVLLALGVLATLFFGMRKKLSIGD